MMRDPRDVGQEIAVSRLTHAIVCWALWWGSVIAVVILISEVMHQCR